MKKQSFILGAIVLTIGGFITKALGAFYKIPLTNILGASGRGVYYLVFPMYSLILSVASSGMNTAVSIMEAIGKLGHTEDIQTIFIWLESYGSDVAERKMYSVFRHAEIAILRLDKSSDKRYHSDFREKYGKYLVDFVPL